MEAPERARSMAARAAEANLILSCRRTSMWGPPGRGTFWFQFFIQAPSPEIWSETISGSEEVLAGKWGGLFLGYLLRKKFIGSRGGTTLYGRGRPGRADRTMPPINRLAALRTGQM